MRSLSCSSSATVSSKRRLSCRGIRKSSVKRQLQELNTAQLLGSRPLATRATAKGKLKSPQQQGFIPASGSAGLQGSPNLW